MNRGWYRWDGGYGWGVGDGGILFVFWNGGVGTKEGVSLEMGEYYTL